MSTKTRIERLEKAAPTLEIYEEFCPDFNFRVAGQSVNESRLELIAALRAAIADRRATEEQRVEWKACAEQFEAALD